ncbi:MAG: right-handed parallel beta-helix repeat-containing protein [Gemmatimonadales bacterium]
MFIRQWIGVIASLVPLAGCPGSRPEESGGPPLAAGSESAEPRFRKAGTTLRLYVAPEGSDNSPGTAAAPLRTVQKAADLVRPGDTVIVRPGVYTGPSRIVSLERSGTSDAWITFRSEIKGDAVLDGRKGLSLEAWYFGPGVGHVRVEGFQIRDLGAHGFDFYGGGVHDIVISGNHVHHIGRNCTDTSNGRTGASLGAGAHRVTLDGNIWHDIGRYAPGERGCSPRTRHYQNHDHGIYVSDADEITIKNNVFHAFGRGWAIHRYSSDGLPSHGLLILNNTFDGPNSYRPGQIILATSTTGARIENNIFHRPNTAAIYFEARRFRGGSVRNNMVHGGVMKVGRPAGVTFLRNWEGTDPRFVSRTDFRLRSDSPAIDSALPLAEVTRDADGVVRPRGDGYDLGAYER